MRARRHSQRRPWSARRLNRLLSDQTRRSGLEAIDSPLSQSPTRACRARDSDELHIARSLTIPARRPRPKNLALESCPLTPKSRLSHRLREGVIKQTPGGPPGVTFNNPGAISAPPGQQKTADSSFSARKQTNHPNASASPTAARRTHAPRRSSRSAALPLTKRLARLQATNPPFGILHLVGWVERITVRTPDERQSTFPNPKSRPPAQKYPSRFFFSIDAAWSWSMRRPWRSLVLVISISWMISGNVVALDSTAPESG